MIKIIGDIHAKYQDYLNIVKNHEYTVQLGDYGFKYESLKDVDHNKHLIIAGNHDNYDSIVNVPNYLGDFGHTVNYNIDFFFYRGAYSIDRQHRTIGVDWWQNEQVTIESFIEARELYRSIKPDIFLSHDCPDFMVHNYIRPDARIYENITNWALGELYKIHQPKLWIHGHYHQSKTTVYGNTKFVCLDELETYTLVKDEY